MKQQKNQDEHTCLAHVVALLERLSVDCVLDVGANVGQWGQGLRWAGYRGRIISFEPIASVFEQLDAAAHDDPHWQVHNIALGAENSQITLNRTNNSVFSSVLDPSDYERSRYPKGIEVMGREPVVLRRLDDLLPELLGDDLVTSRLFLKMDTQGLDSAVFDGAQGLLGRIVGIQSEQSVFPLYSEQPTWLSELAKYQSLGFSPTGFFPVNRTQPYLGLCEFDCVMARHARLRTNTAPVGAPTVAVVVTALGDSAGLRGCLGNVREQVNALAGELILTLNMAATTLQSDVRSRLEGLCDRLVFEPKVGKSHALYAAIASTNAQVIAFTDDDAEPEAGWLAALTAPLLDPGREPYLIGCGGPVSPIYPENGLPAWYREMIESSPTHFLTPRHDYGPESRNYPPPEERKAVVPLGANCAYRREVFDAYHYEPSLGPNRETGLRGGEDTLLARLLLRDGYAIRYCADARVCHAVAAERTTLRCLRRSCYMQGVEAVRMQRLETGELPDKRKAQAKLRKKRLKWLLVNLPFLRRCLTERVRVQRLAKFERKRGEYAELTGKVG